MQAAHPVRVDVPPGFVLPQRTPAARRATAGRTSAAGKRATRYLAEHRLQMVTAETSNGSDIASRLADVPGAANVLNHSFVVDSREATEKDLGVKTSTIDRFQLASEEVALEMARGALARSDVAVAIASTGITDVHDADADAAATQCFAWVFRTGPFTQQAFTETRVFDGSRGEARIAAADHALDAMVDHHRTMLR